MKCKNSSPCAGFSTLEILIAFGILSISLSSALVLIFSTRQVIADADVSNHALILASQELKNAETSGSLDFKSLVSASSSSVAANGDAYDSIFSKTLSVFDLTPCVKNITETISSALDPARVQNTSLSGMVSSASEFSKLGNDCEGVPNAGAVASTTLQDKNIGLPGISATGIDAKNGFAYASALGTSTASDFFAFNTTDSSVSSLDTGPGIQAIDVAGNYAYAANASTSEQLQVIDVSNPNALRLVACHSACSFSSGGALPKSIFYYDGKVYVGTDYSSPSVTISEVHIFDVSNPENPYEIGNLKVSHNVNAIAVANQTVAGVSKTILYLAISASDATMPEVKSYDISSPYPGMNDKTNSPPIGTFNPAGTEYATVLFLLGNRLYVGRQGEGLSKTGEPEFSVLDVTDPTHIGEIEHADLNLATTAGIYVSGIRALGNIVYIATTYTKKPFFEYSLLSHSIIALPTWPKFGIQGIDVENNRLFEGTQNGLSLIQL